MTTKPKVTTQSVESKEVTVIKKQVSKAISYATSLAVESKKDYDAALIEGKEIKTILDNIVAEKEKISKPQFAAYKATVAFFKQFEDPVAKALETIKAKMVTFHKEETAKADDARAKLAAKVDSGYMKPETAMKKSEAIVEPVKTTATENASATMRTVKKWRVVDKSKIPLEFMDPDMGKIKASFRAGTPVAGVEEYEEKELAIS